MLLVIFAFISDTFKLHIKAFKLHIKALSLLYAFEESADYALLSSFCNGSNLHLSLLK